MGNTNMDKYNNFKSQLIEEIVKQHKLYLLQYITPEIINNAILNNRPVESIIFALEQ